MNIISRKEIGFAEKEINSIKMIKSLLKIIAGIT